MVTSLPTVDPALSPVTNAVGYVISDKQVNLPQLQSEIAAQAGNSVEGLTITSVQDEHILWVNPAKTDPSAIAVAFDDHQPDPDWGIPAVILLFNQTMEKVRKNPDVDLTDDEKDSLIRGVALNFAMITDSGD